MTGPAHVVYDDELTAYDFGPGHPMAPVRVDLTISWPDRSAYSICRT